MLWLGSHFELLSSVNSDLCRETSASAESGSTSCHQVFSIKTFICLQVKKSFSTARMTKPEGQDGLGVEAVQDQVI